eukprot:132445_1
MCVPQNYTIKTVSEEVQNNLSSSSFNCIQARLLKHGMYCIDPKSGYPGQVCKQHGVKPGKHGHRKCLITLRLLHNGEKVEVSFSGKTIIQQPIIHKIDYLVSYIDDDQLSCYDDEFEEMFLSISSHSDNQKVYDKLMKCIVNG